MPDLRLAEKKTAVVAATESAGARAFFAFARSWAQAVQPAAPAATSETRQRGS